MNKIWFTSDTHFGHTNILKFGKGRPFSNIEEMDETIIQHWNETVSEGDRVYHLGDFSFSKPERTLDIAKMLKGQKFLVEGNHDKSDRRFSSVLLKEFVWVKPYFKLKVEDKDHEAGRQNIVLFHYAIESWDTRHYGTWHLHGHSHGNLLSPDWQQRLDVGVDMHDFRPISYEQVKEHMKTKTFKQLDHHSDKRETNVY